MILWMTPLKLMGSPSTIFPDGGIQLTVSPFLLQDADASICTASASLRSPTMCSVGDSIDLHDIDPVVVVVCPHAGTTDFCLNHGGGQRCVTEGCDKPAKYGDVRCLSHGGGTRCGVEECAFMAHGLTGCVAVHPALCTTRRGVSGDTKSVQLTMVG